MTTRVLAGKAFGREVEAEYSYTWVAYALLLFGLGAFGAGRILGLARRIEQSEFIRRHAWLRYLLG